MSEATKTNERGNTQDKPAKNRISSKSLLKKHAKNGTKVRFTERKKLEVIVDDHPYYKEGQIITPHVIVGNALIEAKIAKEVK